MNTWRIITPLRYKPIERRVWMLTNDYVLRDHRLRLWLIPAGFRLDFYSVPQVFWWWRPPVDGSDGDGAACLHDFHCRCWRLLGISRSDVQATFRRAVPGLDSTRLRGWTKAVATWPYMLFRSEGEGLSGDERYDHPLPCGTSLPEWVRANYDPAGSGYLEGIRNDAE